MNPESDQTLHENIRVMEGFTPNGKWNELMAHWSQEAIQEDPYHSSELEINTPEQDLLRQQATTYLLELSENKGSEIWKNGSNITSRITQNAATHKALLDVYDGPSKEEETEEGLRFADFALRVFDSPKEARNRFRIVKNIVRDELTKKERKMNVLSIAGGSSKAVLEGIHELPHEKQDQIDVRLVDLSQDALDDGHKLAEALKMDQQLDTIKANFIEFKKYLEDDYHPDMVEVVGLLDYLKDKHVIKLLSKVYEVLPNEGSVLFSNVAHNDEEDFLHEIVQWEDMIYRDADHLSHLAISAGFDPEKLEVITTPKGHTNLILARK